MPARPRRVPLSVSVVDARGRPLRGHRLAAWLSRVAPVRRQAAVTVAVVPDTRVRALNRDYRGKDRATDVLSFPSGLQAPGSRLQGRGARSRVLSPKPVVRSPKPVVRSPKPDAFLGDIVIARGVARRQARDAGHSERTEWRVLALHGLLHLLGYDHETDRGTMARVEARLRRKGGLSAGLIERGPQ
jgi:probable rRNA maturation factor